MSTPPPVERAHGRVVRAVEGTLSAFARATFRRPLLTALLLLGVAALAANSARRLKVDGKLARLLPESFRSVQDLRELQRRFGGIGYVSVLAQGAEPAKLRALAEELAPKLSALPTVRYVDYRQPVEFFRDRALYYLELPALAKLEQRLRARLRYEQARANPLYVDLDDEPPPPLKVEELLREELSGAKKTSKDAARGNTASRLAAMAKEPYYLDAKRRMLVLLVKPTDLASDIGFARRVVAEIRGVLAKVDTRRYGPELTLALTGRYAKRIEQQEQIERDLAIGFGAAAAMIVLFLLLHLRRITSALLVLLPLGLGVLATFGFAAATFGSLNILTAFIGAILLGLGIDHGIHLVDRFAAELAREEVAGPTPSSVETATRQALAHTGRAVVVAALTTVIAFVGLGLSDFRAFHEFGLIGAFGVSAIVLAYLAALPPLLRLATHLGWRPALPADKSSDDARSPRWRWAPLTLWVSVVAIVAIALGAPAARFDYDLGSLESKALPSFRLDQQVNRILGRSQTPVVVLTDSGEQARRVERELLRRKRALGPRSTIDFVLGASSLLPAQQQAKAKVIARLDALVGKFELGELSAQDKRKLADLRRMAGKRPFGQRELPIELRRQLEPVADAKKQTGSFVLVFSRVRLNDGEAVKRLAKEVRALPLEGGKKISAAAEALITADMLELIAKEAPPVLALTGALVFVALWLLVGSLRVALLALLPAVATLALTMGLMPPLGLTFTYLNIIMLPVLFGTSVDGGAHLALRLREAPSGDARAFFGGLREVGRPIAGALLTTGFGFGALIIAEQPGIVGVGKLAVLGLSINLVVTLLVLPALLAVLAQRRELSVRDRWARLWDALSTIGSAGHVPKGGGTVGALAALPFAWALSHLSTNLRLGALGALSVASVWIVDRYLASANKPKDADPSEVVLDEFVGLLLALAFVPWSLTAAALGFVLFRLFDIAKPWPISAIDRRVHGGLGVMLDDIVAGLAAGGVVWALLRLL